MSQCQFPKDHGGPEEAHIRLLKKKPIVSTAKQSEIIYKPEKVPYSVFNNYGVDKLKDKSPMYRTTSSDYGYYPPTAYTVPKRYFALSQTFTASVAPFGMYKDGSLNTGKEHRYVMEGPRTQRRKC